MAWIFWCSVVLAGYVYAGYPLCVTLLAALAQKKGYPTKPGTPIKDGAETAPLPVTLLIAAYNEERVIRATLENKLAQDYPGEQMQILVISDGSTDGTDQVVREFEDQGVRLIRQEPRSGKTAALNTGAAHATGDILVFSDANSLYAPDAVRQLVRPFQDPDVGYVTGKMIYVTQGESPVGDGCSTYMKYENFLREKETRLGSVVGVDGGIDAVRAELYRPMAPDQLPDFVLPLSVVDQGFRVVYAPDAVLREHALADAGDEYRMRVRVSLRALWAIRDMKRLLCMPGNLVFSWQLWSHKVLRYLCILFLITAWLASGFLALDSGFYRVLFLAQTLGYLSAWPAQVLIHRGRDPGVLYALYYFVLVNLAAGHALLRCLKGDKQVLWTPRKG